MACLRLGTGGQKAVLRFRLPFALTLALALSACGPEPLTQDRITPEAMRQMVATPLRHAESGDLPRAQREFKIQLALSDPTARSDLLTAFGVGLLMVFPEKEEDEIRYRRASLPYLERAIPAAAARFGAEHPETALVLNTYGDALKQMSPGDPPRAVDRALQQAYRIRFRTLGPRNRETIANLRALAEVQGLPSRTGGDPERIERVGRMYEVVIAALEVRPDPTSMGPEQVREEQRRMFLRNGRNDRAEEVARRADARERRRETGLSRWFWPDSWRS